MNPCEITVHAQKKKKKRRKRRREETRNPNGTIFILWNPTQRERERERGTLI